MPGSLCSSPDLTPHLSGFPIPVAPERCLISKENDHLMVFFNFFFFGGGGGGENNAWKFMCIGS